MKQLKAAIILALFSILLAPACGGMGGNPPEDAGDDNNGGGDVVNNDSTNTDTDDGDNDGMVEVTFTLPESFTNIAPNAKPAAVVVVAPPSNPDPR